MLATTAASRFPLFYSAIFYSVGMLWSVLYFYCNWQIPGKKKKKKNMGVGGNGSFFVGFGRNGIIYFLWEWDGRGLKIHSRVTL